MPSRIHIGTAGWSIPRPVQRRFPAGESLLARYARVLPAVEINSTFYKTHRAETFERWAAAVPRTFHFSVKLPAAITHERRLARSASLLDEFLDQVSPLGRKLGCLLVQLPPSFVFDARLSRAFFTALKRRFACGVAVEPRHASWLEARADLQLRDLGIARVAADPARAQGDAEPGGWPGLAYFRLHGSPRIYYSSYEALFLRSLAERLRHLRRTVTWCVFDNTASGAATTNALALARQLQRRDAGSRQGGE